MARYAPRVGSAVFVIGMSLVAAPSVWAQRYEAAYSPRAIPDARSRGMGQAFTAIAAGPAAAFWNPGALGFGRTSSTLDLSPFSYHDLESASLYSANAVVQQGGFGFGANLNHVSYDLSNFFPENTTEPSQYTIHTGAGVNLSEVFGPRWQAMPLGSGHYALDVDFGVGVALNIFHADFPVIEGIPSSFGGTGTSTDLDLGTLWVAQVRSADSPNAHPGFVGLRLGGVVSNLFDRDIDLGSNSDPVGRSFRLGLAGEAAVGSNSKHGHAAEFRAAFDLDKFYGKVDSDYGYYYGTEIEFLNLVSARLGHIDNDSFDDTVYGFGIGFELPARGGARFDLATVPVLDSNIYTVSGWTTF